jgi:hypothetical protein
MLQAEEFTEVPEQVVMHPAIAARAEVEVLQSSEDLKMFQPPVSEVVTSNIKVLQGILAAELLQAPIQGSRQG